MPRPIWEGNISFGLIQVPVTLYPAEARSELQFHLLDDKDKSRIKYRKVNETSGEEVPQERIVRAYELDDGEMVVLDEQDFENADVEATQTVDIQAFVDRDDIDRIYFDKPYYLMPGKRGEKGYVLLRETLRKSRKTGIAKVVIKTRQHLAALMPKGNGLVLNLLRYAHELRDMDALKLPEGSLEEFKISPREIDMATSLVEMMTTPWEPGSYRDDYHDALLAWIERKAKEGAQVHPPEPKHGRAVAPVVDFMELLKKSVEQKEKARKEAHGKEDGVHGVSAKRKRA
jgi:DNA end-binding protein Ku